MSVVKPTIDELLSMTGENRFLLCELASRRACDINDMMRNQHNRAQQLLKDVDLKEVAAYLSDDEGHMPNPLSIAFDEIAPVTDADGSLEPGRLSFDSDALIDYLGEDIDPRAVEETDASELEVLDEAGVAASDVIASAVAESEESDSPAAADASDSVDSADGVDTANAAEALDTLEANDGTGSDKL